MSPKIVFVHGIGVRESAFDTTFNVLRDRIARDLPGATLYPCRWGDDLGARFLADGRSVPGYAHLAGPGAADPDDIAAALWQRLYADPLAELGLLAELEAKAPPPPPHLPPPEMQRLDRIIAWRPGAKTAPELAATGLEPDLHKAIIELRAWPGLVRSLRHPDAPAALGRALVARAVVLGEARGVPAPERARVETLARAIAEELEGAHLAPPGVALVLGWIAGIATTEADRRRSLIADKAVPLMGDIVVYQSQGTRIRARIKEVLSSAGEEVAILAHSLGGVAAFELLVDDSEARARCRRLVTVGSQAPFFYEIDALATLRFGSGVIQLAPPFPPWLNFYDRRDFLSFVGAEVFRPHDVRDVEVRSGQPFPQSHSAYWAQEGFWGRLLPVLAGG